MNEVYVVESESDCNEARLHPKCFKTLEDVRKYVLDYSKTTTREWLGGEEADLIIEEKESSISKSTYCHYIETYILDDEGGHDYNITYWISRLEVNDERF